MSTLAQFRSTLRTRGNFPADDTRFTDAVLDAEINRALKRIALRHDWPWLQKERVIVTSADQATYALPSDFLRALSLRFQNSPDALSLRDVQETDQWTGTASPRLYSVWAGKINLAPTPAGEETLVLRYIRQENLLENDTDEPLIPDYWDDGVTEAALVELHRQAKQLDESGLAEARFQQWLAESRDNIRQTRGTPRVRVRPGSFI